MGVVGVVQWVGMVLVMLPVIWSVFALVLFIGGLSVALGVVGVGAWTVLVVLPVLLSVIVLVSIHGGFISPVGSGGNAA